MRSILEGDEASWLARPYASSHLAGLEASSSIFILWQTRGAIVYTSSSIFILWQSNGASSVGGATSVLEDQNLGLD